MFESRKIAVFKHFSYVIKLMGEAVTEHVVTVHGGHKFAVSATG